MADLEARLQRFVGREAEPRRTARYRVNDAMIRNWVEALDDYNPVYIDRAAAVETGRDTVVCPPAMVSTWVMSGLRRYREVQALRARGEAEPSAYSEMLGLLDAHGFTAVVATDVEQDYAREIRPGDHVVADYLIESVSGRKSTALGDGHFITLAKTYLESETGDVLCTERFRLLRYAPTAAAQ
ncbi:FAS1-like dehydratase domain-containing protein [Gordonia neofelifaecis]|uniref:FAS1-like dehydratase domain-containing protein n=1 Tax=Gordonia neofelifaecis NRRL B-59395 TaxID=644548 RepID=F1YNV6_9ACTN|nr:MaoC family dehydratase N-terminal domain-containing protein [Gordonia neofelifaecis]EGD53575.1 hypothetical protein SCNU_18027 [Gordonia neofelifaecis NRRL B-59395]